MSAGVGRHKKVVLCLGTDVTTQIIDRFLEVIDDIARISNEIKFVFRVSPSTQFMIEAKIFARGLNDSVIFLNPKSDQAPWLIAADILTLLTPDLDNMNRIISAAMQGLPVLYFPHSIDQNQLSQMPHAVLAQLDNPGNTFKFIYDTIARNALRSSQS
jgi:hypothetical protein